MAPPSQTVPSSTTAPAAMMVLLCTTALSITMAPMPMSTLSCTVQPCTMALCPMEILLPIIVFVRLKVQWITAPSCTFTLFPIRMLLTSPRTTALNHTLHSVPISTSPTMVQLGAIKQSSPHLGNTPSTGKINAITSTIYEL